MSPEPKPVEHVQDTARWVAMARALESERPDALFKDPFARKLAGPVGAELTQRLMGGVNGTWPIVARTHVIDRLVMEAVRDGVDSVLNLAAGFDSRPYRLELPSTLTWIEVDQSDVIADKETELREASPKCQLERIALDLAAVDARRALFTKVGARFQRTLVMTEGLLCYLPESSALGLAADLLTIRSLHRWIVNLPNSAVLRFIAKRTRNALQGTATMQFGPDNGPLVFEPLGWKTVSSTSLFKLAGKLKRLPFPMSFFARLPERPYGNPKRPWSGVCVLERAR